MGPLVIYHAGCADGFCAAWLMRRAFPDADFVPAQYGTAPPVVTGRDVFVVDFSYKRPEMLAMVAAAKSVTVLDHHKTAEVELSGLPEECNRLYGVVPNIIFKMERSGGRLVWEYLEGEKASPWLVDYTEDRDLWVWKLPHSHAINAALRSYQFDFTRWDQLAESDPSRLASEGTAILRAQQQVVDSHVGFAREIEFAGHKVLAVNATVHSSEIAGELAKGRPFGLCWFRRGDGKYIVSLRSNGNSGIDVSEVAKAFGGGGHRNAAGCALSQPPG